MKLPLQPSQPCSLIRETGQSGAVFLPKQKACSGTPFHPGKTAWGELTWKGGGRLNSLSDKQVSGQLCDNSTCGCPRNQHDSTSGLPPPPWVPEAQVNSVQFKTAFLGKHAQPLYTAKIQHQAQGSSGADLTPATELLRRPLCAPCASAPGTQHEENHTLHTGNCVDQLDTRATKQVTHLCTVSGSCVHYDQKQHREMDKHAQESFFF